MMLNFLPVYTLKFSLFLSPYHREIFFKNENSIYELTRAIANNNSIFFVTTSSKCRENCLEIAPKFKTVLLIFEYIGLIYA